VSVPVPACNVYRFQPAAPTGSVLPFLFQFPISPLGGVIIQNTLSLSFPGLAGMWGDSERKLAESPGLNIWVWFPKTGVS
jgi:hypothetical protein